MNLADLDLDSLNCLDFDFTWTMDLRQIHCFRTAPAAEEPASRSQQPRSAEASAQKASPKSASNTASIAQQVRHQVSKVLSVLMTTLERFPEAAAAVRQSLNETLGPEPTG